MGMKRMGKTGHKKDGKEKIGEEILFRDILLRRNFYKMDDICRVEWEADGCAFIGHQGKLSRCMIMAVPAKPYLRNWRCAVWRWTYRGG